MARCVYVRFRIFVLIHDTGTFTLIFAVAYKNRKYSRGARRLEAFSAETWNEIAIVSKNAANPRKQPARETLPVVSFNDNGYYRSANIYI